MPTPTPDIRPALPVADLRARLADQTPPPTVARWLKSNDGSYLPVLKPLARWITTTVALDEVFGDRRLKKTLYRLCAAGFVKHRRPSPSTLQIDLESLLDHLDETEQNPDFWNRENLQRFNDAAT